MGPIRPVEIMLSQQASYRTMRLLVLLLTGFAALLSSVSAGDDWQTNRHEKGICALYGNAGHRKDGDPLLMPSNQAARPLPSDAYAVLQSSCPQLTAEFGGVNGTYCCDAQQVHDLSTKVQQGLIFLLGCPACAHNFRHFFCTLTCSPEQSLFANVTAVQLAPDTNATAVAEVEYYLTDIFGKRFYESCKDVVFSVANTKAMNFVGGGAKNWTEWAQFLGLVKDKRFPKAGSPFQMDFPGEAATPPSMQAMNESLPACWDSALRCSCGDCPDAPSCEPPEPAPAPRQPGCIPGLRSIRCGDLITTALYLALLYVLYRWFKNQSKPSGGLDGLYGEEDGSGDPLLRENSQEFAAVDVQYPYVERCLRRHFKRQGVWCAENPGRTLAACALGVLLLSMGLIRFHVETDPAHLWVGRGSRALQDKQSYEAAFGPFMRIEQLIISTLPSSKTSTLPPIITDANIKLLFDIQERVDNLTAPFQGRSGGNATLKSVCYKPFGDVCATQSLLQYWQMDRALYVSGVPPYHIKLSPEFCFSHWSTQCRADFGGPVDPHVVMGGFPTDSSFVSYTANATSFVVTYPIDSTASNRDAALAWEAAFLKLAATEVRVMAETAGLRVSFSTERSVQDELSRESSADAGTVLLSYLAMLVYIAFALSSLPRRAPLSSLLVYSRLGLGVGGVIIVAASVIAALGVCSAVGMWSTLIIMEVIPFLILAVGVDNLFIISQTLDRQPPSAALPERLGNALAAAGPSITLAAAAETLAFGMAALTPMPAVRNFSAVAAVAVILDYILQVTAFVALLALDARRMEEGRLDIAPCARISSLATTPDQATVPEEDGHYHSLSEYGLPSPDNSLRGGSAAMDSVRGGGASRLGLTQALQWYMANVHAPLLALPVVQVAILALFGGMFLLSAALLPRTSVGLEQQIALPRDSYLQPYFSDVASVLRVGPPLFLVVEDLNMSRSATDVNRICSVSGCDDRSLMNQVSKAAQSPVVSYIASPAASWLDDFLSWISPEVGQCCRSFPEHSSSGHGYCPPADQPPCAGNVSACADCSVCFRSWGGPGPDLLVDSRPSRDQVKERLPWFMEAKPSAECAKGGAGAYTDAIQQDSNGGLAGLEHGIISASAFRTSYVPLAHQADFIEGLKAVTSMVDRVSAELGLRIYSFSVWHVFFEQYLSIARDSVHILGAAAMAVLAACWLLTASLWASLIMLAVIGMILIDMVGAMYLAGIQLNAVSLVNLTMALGIAVEFCAHPVHAFLEARGTRPERSAAALRSAGAAVLSGITVTKFIGVLVLASARTQIFEVYFYRMYLALVLLGAGHGLLLLPVLLALAGPPPFGESHILQDAQEEVQAAADSLPDS